MTSAYIAKLYLKFNITDVEAYKIVNFILKSFNIVLSSF